MWMFSWYRRLAGSMWLSPIVKNGSPSGVINHQWSFLFPSVKKPWVQFEKLVLARTQCHGQACSKCWRNSRLQFRSCGPNELIPPASQIESPDPRASHLVYRPRVGRLNDRAQIAGWICLACARCARNATARPVARAAACCSACFVHPNELIPPASQIESPGHGHLIRLPIPVHGD